jgi:hypothetical protein
VLARHPSKERWDAFWIVAGSVADWGPLPSSPDELERRTSAALSRRPRSRRDVSPEQVDEIRIVHCWIAAHDPPRLELDYDAAPSAGELAGWVASVCSSGGSGTELVTHQGGSSWESWTR